MMTIDPEMFEWEAERLGIEWPVNGAMVRYWVKAHPGSNERLEYVGRVARVWMGIEVMVDVEGGPGFCPALGDTFEVVAENQ